VTDDLGNKENRYYHIERLTLTSVNDHVNDLESRLQAVEIKLGLREPEDDNG
jgi:hypothetical protein